MAIKEMALGVALVAAVACHAAHADGGPDHYRVTGLPAGGAVHLRATPSAQGDILGYLPAGTQCLRNLGCEGGLTMEEFTSLPDAQRRDLAMQRPRWCKVDYRGTTGWVAGRYLSEGTCKTAQSQAAPSAAPVTPATSAK